MKKGSTDRSQTAFCESGGPGSQNAGNEYLHLPAIVDAAESSPAAAREAANTVRNYLSKINYQKAYAQYNAIMLLRILTDNPGTPFTQNFDQKFVATVKQLLRECRDNNVQQITRETLDYFEAQKAPTQESLGLLMQMWKKEKSKGAIVPPPVVRTCDISVSTKADSTQVPYGRAMGQGRTASPQGGYRASRPPRQLPPPGELAARIEEARTTARLLVQTVQSTPQNELLSSDLVKEFGERAKSAHKSIQGYMACENPAADEDTMLTLIETIEQLNVAMSKRDRTLLQARKALGVGSPSPRGTPAEEQNSFLPQHTIGQNVYGHPRQNNETFAPPPGPPPPRHNLNENNVDLSSFVPPVGPPPSHKAEGQQNRYEYENAYAPTPQNMASEPTRNRPDSRTDYGVAEDPFSDEQSVDQRQSKYSNPIFGRQQPPAQPQPTQSYMRRQDSSANNVTMHGGS